MKDEMKMKVKFIKESADRSGSWVSLLCGDSVRARRPTKRLLLRSGDGSQVE